MYLNLNSLFVKSHNDKPSPGNVTGWNYSLALARDMYLVTQSSDTSAEELREPDKSIMKTCPCNEHPFTPHFYIVKLGFTRRVYTFSYFCSKAYIVGTR